MKKDENNSFIKIFYGLSGPDTNCQKMVITELKAFADICYQDLIQFSSLPAKVFYKQSNFDIILKITFIFSHLCNQDI